MKLRASNRFLAATFAATGLALSLSASYALTATKAGTGTDLADAASWTGGSGPGFPTSADIATWNSTSLGAGLTLGSAGSWGGISASGALSDIDISGVGTLTVGSSGIGMSASTVNLSIANPVTLSAGQTWNVNAAKTLTLSGNVAGGQNLTIAGGGTSTLSGSGTSSFGTLAVGTTGSSATTSTLSLSSGTTTFAGRPCIGSAAAARGLVTVSGTATLTFTGDNLMFAGSGASNLRATAVIKQSGGTVNDNVTASTLMPWAGSGGVAYGAYLFSNGTLNVAKEFRVNNQGSDLGFFSQSGGDSTFTNGIVLNNNGGCNFPAIADISGGTLTHPSTGNLMAPIANLGVLTVRGTGYLTDKSTNFSVASNGTGILNLLAGGTIEANQIKKVGGTATMNCDGGTLKAYTTNAGASFLTGLNNMFLYSGGLTLDTAGQSVTIGQPLIAPAGYGVGTSLGTIAVPTGGNGYVAPPLVTFAAPASGVAATGVAEIDANGTVTQIRITSPGSGYTSGQAVAVTFNGGDNTANEAVTVATPPTVIASTLNAAGGLTKINSGTLTLNNTETYTGATTVNAGTLALGASGVLNSASNVSLAAGGTLDVSGLGASATYTLGSGATLLASGTGTTVGTDAAAIKGGATGTVSLGSRPLTLTWSGAASGTDSTHPALTVSQGTLSLNNNQFTVVSGTALGVGVYTLATAPAITGSVNPTPLYTGGSGLAGGLVGVVTLSSTSVILTVSVPATIMPSGTLSAVSTIYGTPSGETSFTLSGSTLTAGIVVQPPAGYEVSTTSGSGYSGNGVSITVGSPPTLAATTIYVRLAANAPVSGTFDAQNITLSTPGAITNIATAATGNSVSAKPLTIVSAVGNSKMYDGTTAATVTGTLDSAEAFGAGTSGDGKPYTGDVVTAGAPGTFASAAVGNGIAVTAGTFTLGGASAGNYSVIQPTGLSLSANILNTAVWTQLAGGSWTTAGNWQDNIIGYGTGNTADFSTLSLPANATVTLDGARTIGNLLFDDQNATKHSWTVNPNIAGALTLAVDTGTPAIGNNVPVTISTVLAGTQGLTKIGTDTLTLSGNNIFSGTVTLSRGTLAANHANAVGTGTASLVMGDSNTGANPVDLKVDTAVASKVQLASVANSNFGTSQTITLNAGSALSANAAGMGTTLNLDGTVPVTLKATNTGGHSTAQDMNWRIVGTGIPAGTTALTLDGSTFALRTSQLGDATAASNFTGDVLIKGNVTTQCRTYLAATAGNQNLTFVNNDVTVNTSSTWTLVWGGETCGALNGSSTSTVTLNNQNALNSVGLTLGNNDRSGSFSGAIGGGFGVAKNGTGTQTLSGLNTYTGNTTVNAGTLALADNGRLTFVIGATSGTNNSISGAGTVTLDGDFAINTTAAAALTTGTWLLENVTSLTGAYGATFTVMDPNGSLWTDAGANKWTKTVGSKLWSFDETTGTLTLSVNGYNAWAASWTSPALSDTTPGGDPDNDGITNLMEYVLGGDPRVSSTQFLPTQAIVGSNLVISYKRSDDSETDTTQTGQWSTDLATWTNIAPVLVNENGTSPDDMTVTIPMSNAVNGKLFGRLKVTQP